MDLFLGASTGRGAAVGPSDMPEKEDKKKKGRDKDRQDTFSSEMSPRTRKSASQTTYTEWEDYDHSEISRGGSMTPDSMEETLKRPPKLIKSLEDLEEPAHSDTGFSMPSIPTISSPDIQVPSPIEAVPDSPTPVPKSKLLEKSLKSSSKQHRTAVTRTLLTTNEVITRNKQQALKQADSKNSGLNSFGLNPNDLIDTDQDRKAEISDQLLYVVPSEVSAVLSFPDVAEAEYLSFNKTRTLSRTRKSFLAWALLNGVLLAYDYYSFVLNVPSGTTLPLVDPLALGFELIHVVRLLMILLCLLTFGLTYLDAARGGWQTILIVLGILIGGWPVALTWYYPQHYLALEFTFLFLQLFIGIRFWRSTTICTLMLAGFEGIRTYQAPIQYPEREIYLFFILLVCTINAYWVELSSRKIFMLHLFIDSENYKTDRLLRQTLPDSVVTRFQRSRANIATHYEGAVMFVEIKDFMDKKSTIKSFLTKLSQVFLAFDDLVHAAAHVTHLGTDGTRYIIVSDMDCVSEGIDYTKVMSELALDLLKRSRKFKAEGTDINIRISMAHGSIVTGVLGSEKRFKYDVLGPTVKVAGKLLNTTDWESIVMCESFKDTLDESSFNFEKIGTTSLRTGHTRLFNLLGRVKGAKNKSSKGKSKTLGSPEPNRTSSTRDGTNGDSSFSAVQGFRQRFRKFTAPEIDPEFREILERHQVEEDHELMVRQQELDAESMSSFPISKSNLKLEVDGLDGELDFLWYYHEKTTNKVRRMAGVVFFLYVSLGILDPLALLGGGDFVVIWTFLVGNEGIYSVAQSTTNGQDPMTLDQLWLQVAIMWGIRVLVVGPVGIAMLFWAGRSQFNDLRFRQSVYSIFVGLCCMGIIVMSVIVPEKYQYWYLGFLYICFGLLYSIRVLTYAYAVTMGTIVALTLLVTYGFVVPYLIRFDSPIGYIVNKSFYTLMSADYIMALACYWMEYNMRVVFLLNLKYAERKEKSDMRLANLVPSRQLCHALKHDNSPVLAQKIDNVSIMYVNLLDYHDYHEGDSASADEQVFIVNEIFRELDKVVLKYGLRRLKTVGDAYVIVSTLRSPGHTPSQSRVYAIKMMKCAHAILKLSESFETKVGVPVQLRLGATIGHVLVGALVHGDRIKMDVWGETMDVCQVMERRGHPGRCQVSVRLYTVVRDKFDFFLNQTVELADGKEMKAYVFNGGYQ